VLTVTPKRTLMIYYSIIVDCRLGAKSFTAKPRVFDAPVTLE